MRGDELAATEAAQVLRRHLHRVGEHVDVWAAVHDGAALRACVAALAGPGRLLGVTRVVAIEARGFALGGAVAVELGVGLVTIRKSSGLSSEGKLCETTAADWRGRTHELWLRAVDVSADDRLLLVDDWIETGSQAVAAGRLVRAAGAELVGVSVLVDQLADNATRLVLPPVSAILHAGDVAFAP
jgi:adenine phosphoribosyltransferase